MVTACPVFGSPLTPFTPQSPSALADLSERLAGRSTYVIAGGLVGVMAALALAPSAFADKPGHVFPAFLPVFGALWGMAELLTAYLLLSQFMVNGVRLFLGLGAAYAFTGLLTIPYLLSFPGALGNFTPFTRLDLSQTATALWGIWHLAFPLIIAAAVVNERWSSTRVVGGSNLRRECVRALTIIAAACLVTAVPAFWFGNLLPTLVKHGQLTRLFQMVVAPSVLCANAAAAVLVVRRTRPTGLHVWIAVALVMATIDAALNATTVGRYTPRWYDGKVLTLATATVVLVALLAEIAALYRRLGTLAMIDPLTGLHNRGTFDDRAAWMLRLLRRRGGEATMLMIDVDLFKGYNDSYGHAAGDACLRRVGQVLNETLRRGGDVVARYGGEEFVALLPETSRANAIAMAERARSGVQALAIPYDGGASGSGVVTISVGVAHTYAITEGDPAELLASADRALYAAKHRRNITVVSGETTGRRRPAAALVAP
jgi:diguanylate cyclase (GGDEF)-like protein